VGPAAAAAGVLIPCCWRDDYFVADASCSQQRGSQAKKSRYLKKKLRRGHYHSKEGIGKREGSRGKREGSIGDKWRRKENDGEKVKKMKTGKDK